LLRLDLFGKRHDLLLLALGLLGGLGRGGSAEQSELGGNYES
jgi:hypothetical protein